MLTETRHEMTQYYGNDFIERQGILTCWIESDYFIITYFDIARELS